MRRKSLLSAPSCSNRRRHRRRSRRRQEPGPGARATGAPPTPPPDGSAPPGGWPGSAFGAARAERGSTTPTLASRPGTQSSTAGRGCGQWSPRASFDAARTRDKGRGWRAPRVGAVFARSGQGSLSGWAAGDPGPQPPGRHRERARLSPTLSHSPSHVPAATQPSGGSRQWPSLGLE